MNIDNIMDNLLEKMLDGDFDYTKKKNIRIPETKLVVVRQNSSKWWIQVPTPPEMGFPNNRKRLPTNIYINGTKSFLEACRFGLKILYKNEVLEAEGMPLFELKPTVKSISLKVIEKLRNAKQKKKTHEDYIRVLEKEIIPQLGNIYIQNLRLKEITEFFHNKKARSSTRMTITKSAFDKIFNYAELNNIIMQRDRPDLSKLEIEVDKKPEYVAFRDDDIDFIDANIQSYIDASRNKITRENRELFKFYISFLRTTGVRTGEEANGILWKHIFISKAKNDRIIVKIEKGKIAQTHNKTREICIDQETIENLMKLLMFQTGFNESMSRNLKEGGFNETVQYGNVKFNHEDLIDYIRMFKLENQPIFARKEKKYKKNKETGKEEHQYIIPNFVDCFDQLKEFLDNRLSSEELTLYSYRHYFITDRMLNKVDIHHVARYCGTSVEMVDGFYSKLKARMASEHVIKDLDLEVYKLA